MHSKYYSKIDGLRFVAIFLVLLHHFAIFIGRYFSPGYYGVDLFFVISGFLITGILTKQNQDSFATNYKNFIGRRTLRIFPIYYLTLLILWLVGLPVIRQNFIYFLTYTFNYAMIKYHINPYPVIHFWSLCVEEQFYLFWPIIAISLKNSRKALTVIVLVMIFIGYAQTMFSIFPSFSQYNYFGLLTRMASLGLGALGSILLNKQLLPEKLLQNKLFEYCMFVILISSLMLTYKLKSYVLSPVLGLCSLFLVLKAALYGFHLKPVENFLSNKKIIYIGTLAYGIYVFHLPIEYFFTNYIFNPLWFQINFAALGRFKILETNPWIIKFPVLSFLSFVMAAFSYKYFEKPVLKLKDKFFQ